MEKWKKAENRASPMMKIQWDNGRWIVQEHEVPRVVPPPETEFVISEPRNPEKVHWVVVGDANGSIPVWMGEGLTSPMSYEKLSTGSVVEQDVLKGLRLRFILREGTGPKNGWVNTTMDGAQLLVLEDEYNAYMKNRIVFSGGRWKNAPAPWIKWMPREEELANYTWTEKGIEKLRPKGVEAGDKFTAKHFLATHSHSKSLDYNDLEKLGFIAAPVQEEEGKYVFTAKGMAAIFASNQGTLNYEKTLAQWGNPEAGSIFNSEHLKLISKLTNNDITYTMLLGWGFIEEPVAIEADPAAEDDTPAAEDDTLDANET